MSAFQIIASARLKSHPVARFLDELGTDIRYLPLRRGEFVLGGKFGIKYYTGPDFVRAIKDRSFYREILEIKRAFSHPLIIIECENLYDESDLTLAAIHGALMFASVPNRVPILTTRNDTETAQMIFMMSAQASQNIDWQMADRADPENETAGRNNGDPRLGIVAHIPDVGPSLAKNLLKHFGSLSRLFAARIKDLRKVQGIGLKRAEKIHAFLNGKKAA